MNLSSRFTVPIRKYLKLKLNKEEFSRNPIIQFDKWFNEARQFKIYEPNAMAFATVDKNCTPSLRTLMLKIYDNKGFVFFTDYLSKKAEEIDENSSVAMLFMWNEIERQVKIKGNAEKVSPKEILEYFYRTTKSGTIGVWIKERSDLLKSRVILEEKFISMLKKTVDKNFKPDNLWGGYRVIPQEIEFWQGSEIKNYNKVTYKKRNGNWIIE